MGINTAYLSQCEGKLPFDSFSLAKKAASRRDERDVYKCQHCRKFHVGHKTKKFVSTKGRKHVRYTAGD
jgi:hypothetical protein